MASGNPGIPLTSSELSWLEHVRVNTSAVERRAQTLLGRRTVKKQWQVEWLLKMIGFIDLTTLNGDDSPHRVERLCAKALQPLDSSLWKQLSATLKTKTPLTTAAVCVYHEMLAPAKKFLQQSEIKIPVAAVSTGFPAGLSSSKIKEKEVIEAVQAGADEIDMVISRHLVFKKNWQGLYQEIKGIKKLCGSAHLKVILATGDLQTLKNVATSSWVAMMAGADFIKTSTGKETHNATLPVCLVMMRAIRDYHLLTGHRVGFKPAGGISNTKQGLSILYLLQEELGEEWMDSRYFRLGASSLLHDIERQLFHAITGHYSSEDRHSMG